MNRGISSTAITQNEEVLQQQRAISRLVRKLDRRLIPFIVMLSIIRFGFQVALGHVQLTSFKSDLALTTEENSWAMSIFFLGYLVFAIPSSFLLRILGPTRYLSISLISWGAITMGLAFVKNAYQLIIVRFLLGMAAASYFPGIIFYFSIWYRKREQTMRIAIFLGAEMISNASGGILVYGISQMHNIAGLKNWQWIFLVEGLPLIPLGIVMYVFLGNIPETVQWLNNCEKQLLTNLLRDDAGAANSEPTLSTIISWRQVRYAFVDWRIYLYAVIAIGDLTVIKYLAIYLPSLVYEIDDSKTYAHLMTAPPYLVACLCCVLGGYSSSRRNEHGFHLAFFVSMALLGFILMISLIDYNKWATYASTCIASGGTFGALTILLSWLTNNVGGHTKRVMAIGFAMSMGQIGGIVMPQMFREIDKSTYRRGHIVISSLLASILIVTFIQRFSLMMENRRRNYLSQDEYERRAAIKEACDWHPDVRYVL